MVMDNFIQKSPIFNPPIITCMLCSTVFYLNRQYYFANVFLYAFRQIILLPMFHLIW